jgi:hypothetical protein
MAIQPPGIQALKELVQNLWGYKKEGKKNTGKYKI